MKQVTVWEKLKLQIDNLEAMHKHHQKGSDVSVQVYWQVEYLNEILGTVEDEMGAGNIRKSDMFL